VVKDTALYNESLLISKAMQKCSGQATHFLELESNGSTDLHKIIINNHERFISYLHKLGLSVEHQEKTTNFQNSSTTILTLKTTCFKVDFNDNFAIISPLK